MRTLRLSAQRIKSHRRSKLTMEKGEGEFTPQESQE
jgi:hypothetical protein